MKVAFALSADGTLRQRHHVAETSVAALAAVGNIDGDVFLRQHGYVGANHEIAASLNMSIAGAQSDGANIVSGVHDGPLDVGS